MNAPPDPKARPAAGARFQEMLARLREDFELQLPARLERARVLADECRQSPQATEAITELHRLMHTLAGSSATFGQRPLGDKAKAIEEQLDALMTKPDRSGADFERIARWVGELPGLIGT